MWRGPEFVAIPFEVGAPVVDSIGVFGPAAPDVLLFSVNYGRVGSFSVGHRWLEAQAQEFPGGEEAMMGFEIGEIAQHHVDQKADGGAAVVGLLPDQVDQVLVKGRRVSGSGSGSGGTAGHAVLGGKGGDDLPGRSEAELEELAGGIEPMAGAGIFQAALHDIDEEADDKATVAGLLPNNVGEGLMEGRMETGIEHIFYFRV